MVHKDINHETLLEQYVADGQSVGAVSSHTFSKLTTGHTIRAGFEPITFTVTFVDGITGDSFSAGWLALTLFSGATAAYMVLLRRKKAD